jgi:large repetitive protein
LTGTNSLGQFVTQTATTAADGSYSFTGLLPGTYSLTETPPPGFLPGTDSVGNVNGVTDGTFSQQYLITNILLQAGQSGINYNFGEIVPSGPPA